MKNTFKNIILSLLTLFTVTAFAQESSTNLYLTISHEIADYTSWKIGFDKHLSKRIEAGLTDIFVKQNINNTNSVTALFKVKNLEKAQAFVSDPKLKEAMTKAGVTSAPEIVFYKSAEELTTINNTALITIVSHAVKDFFSWKNVYDSAGEIRKTAGVNDHLILRSLADENVIAVLGATYSAAKFNEFMTNPGLKGAMEKGGVISKPEIKVLL